MITAKEVHEKLLDISNKYISGAPAVSIRSLQDELAISHELLLAHINSLKTEGIVELAAGCVDQVQLTACGRVKRF